MNFIYRMKITGGSKGEMISEYPQWKTSVTINLEPGTYYNVTIEAVAGTRVLAAGELPFKSSNIIQYTNKFSKMSFQF